MDWCYPLNASTHVEESGPGHFPFWSRAEPARESAPFATPSFWGRRIRFRSRRESCPKSVISEACGFCTSVFETTLFRATWSLAKICEGLERKRPYPLELQSRIEWWTKTGLLRMKKAGCEQIQFGIESMSPDVQEFLGKRLDPDRVASVLELCRQIGIRSCAYFITGVPGQTPASLRCDVDLFRLHGLQEAIVSPLCYYRRDSSFLRSGVEGGSHR